MSSCFCLHQKRWIHYHYISEIMKELQCPRCHGLWRPHLITVQNFWPQLRQLHYYQKYFLLLRKGNKKGNPAWPLITFSDSGPLISDLIYRCSPSSCLCFKFTATVWLVWLCTKLLGKHVFVSPKLQNKITRHLPHLLWMSTQEEM